MNTQTISILGCGWLGLPLAQALLSRGYTIKGSSTSEEKLALLKDLGIQPYLIRLEPELSHCQPADFFDCDVLIVNIPPGTRKHGESYHPRQARAIWQALQKSPCRKLIYISATSVYADGQGERREADVQSPEQAANKALAEAEQLFLKAESLNTCVLRLGGLMGGARIPARYAAGRSGLPGPRQPVNYLHRSDAVGAIMQALEKEAWGEVFNVVAPQHPSRQAVYEASALASGYPQPDFDETDQSTNKTVSSDKLISQLGYQFQQPDPLTFPYGED